VANFHSNRLFGITACVVRVGLHRCVVWRGSLVAGAAQNRRDTMADAAAGSRITSAASSFRESPAVNAANQILFQDSLYTTMKLQAADQEVLQNRQAAKKEAELSRLAKLRAGLAQRDQTSRVTIDVSELLGGASSTYNSVAVLAVAQFDTVRNLKVALIQQLQLQCVPEDLELYVESCCLQPLKDCSLLSSIHSTAFALKSPVPYTAMLIASYS
jgi:hypothetical protein